MTSGKRPAAFFDVDGTLLTVQSGTLYLGYLRRHGLMDLSDLVRIYWSFLTYRLGMLNVKGLAEVSSRWLAGQLEIGWCGGRQGQEGPESGGGAPGSNLSGHAAGLRIGVHNT